jgi:hypothetical protein
MVGSILAALFSLLSKLVIAMDWSIYKPWLENQPIGSKTILHYLNNLLSN